MLGLEGDDGKPLFRNELAVALLAVAIIAVMTTICVIGAGLSAHLQRVLTLAGRAALMLAAGISEESENSDRAPGLAGMASTVILVITYVAVTIALVAYAGLGKVEKFDDDAGVLGAVADQALGGFRGEAVPHEVADGGGKVEAIGVSEEAADAGEVGDPTKEDA